MIASLCDLFCNVDLQSLVPKCAGCFENFDAFLRAPYMLPCCHTFCLACLAQQKERKKRKCTICRAKYTNYTMNAAFLSLITQIREIIVCYQRSSTFCEECGKQALITSMRRCYTCEIELQEMVEHSFQTCSICLECCVEHHNGHKLQRIFSRKDKPKSNTTKRSLPITSKFVPHKLKLQCANPTPLIFFMHEASDSALSSAADAPHPVCSAIKVHGVENEIYAGYMNTLINGNNMKSELAPEIRGPTQEEMSPQNLSKDSEAQHHGSSSNLSPNENFAKNDDACSSLPKTTSKHNYVNVVPERSNLNYMNTL